VPWDYHEQDYLKQAAGDPAWHLERLILYGLNGSKIDRKVLEKHLPTLHIPEDRRAFLELLLWNKPF
jgi:hypothetical protein